MTPLLFGLDLKMQIRQRIKDAAEQRLEWQNKHHDLNDYAEAFVRWKKTKAPRAWSRSVVALHKYVLHYFLNIRECNNVNLWQATCEAIAHGYFAKAYLATAKELAQSVGISAVEIENFLFRVASTNSTL